MAEPNELGKQGEDLAVAHLLKNDYEIVALNFRYHKAEVDIIARKGPILTAVEVKTRSTPDFGDPQSFLKQKQISSLIKAPDYFVNQQQLDVEVRFDIIAIIKIKSGTKIEHLEDAFLHF